MKRAILAIGTCVALAGTLAACGKQPAVTAENASIAEVAEKVKGNTPKLDPGQWETTVEFVSADVPGLPPQIAETMKSQMAAQGKNVHQQCITKEMADKPPSEMLTGKAADACKYDKFAMAGGKMDAVLSCKGQGQAGAMGDMKMAMTGTFTATAFDMTQEMTMNAPGAPAPMTIKSKIISKRTGDCA